ncbi:MAG: hypothetical protein ACI4R9_07890, partial [Kiritimatiellia bacterium]
RNFSFVYYQNVRLVLVAAPQIWIFPSFENGYRTLVKLRAVLSRFCRFWTAGPVCRHPLRHSGFICSSPQASRAQSNPRLLPGLANKQRSLDTEEHLPTENDDRTPDSTVCGRFWGVKNWGYLNDDDATAPYDSS